MIRELPEYRHIVVYLKDDESLIVHFQQYATMVKIPFRSAFSLFPASRKLRRVIRDNQVSAIHAHLWTATVIARLAAPSGIPFLFTLHTHLSREAFDVNPMSLWVERLTYNKRHHLLSVSQTVLDDYRSYVNLTGPSRVLYNFVNPVFFERSLPPLTPEKFIRAVAVGNLRLPKNYPYLLRCVASCTSNFSLDIYGRGTLQQELETYIREKDLPVRIRQSTEIHTVLSGYDIFVMASTHEGFGISLMEAMATGLPVLLSDIPVFREIAGESAFYFSLDDVSDFGKKVQQISELKASGELANYGKRCRERASKIASREVHLGQLRSIYSTLF